MNLDSGGMFVIVVGLFGLASIPLEWDPLGKRERLARLFGEKAERAITCIVSLAVIVIGVLLALGIIV